MKFIGFLLLATVSLYAQIIPNGGERFLGNGLGDKDFSNYTDYWNQVSPGNAGKWGSVETQRDKYNWTRLDEIYNLANQNELMYKHHTLVWGNQQPGWIESLPIDEQRAEVEEWIKLVGERYPNMDQCDVVNEPLHAPPAYAEALGGKGQTGWDWVITSFELARKYLDPSVELILNEYNVFGSSESNTKYLEIINLLKERNLIDAIGVQGHYFEFRSPEGSNSPYKYPISTIKSNLNKLIDTGLPVYITEFDVNEKDDQDQLDNYKTYFPIFWENTGVRGITLWGYVENHIWKANAFLLDERYRERPAMEWLKEYVNLPFRPILIEPRLRNEPRNPFFKWHPIEDANLYNIQVSRDRSFNMIVSDTTVADTTFQSGVLDSLTTYYWHVNSINDQGASEFSDYLYFKTGNLITSVDKFENERIDFKLYQNYPNPFNPSTEIEYTISVDGRSQVNVQKVTLTVYDILGRNIATLVNESKSPGKYKVEFDASNLASGTYIYQLRSGEKIETKKMLLLR